MAEIEHSKYNLDHADVKLLPIVRRLRARGRQCLANELVNAGLRLHPEVFAHLQRPGRPRAIGVTERAHYFARMRT